MSYLESLFNFHKNIVICGAGGYICSEIAKSFVMLKVKLIFN